MNIPLGPSSAILSVYLSLLSHARLKWCHRFTLILRIKRNKCIFMFQTPLKVWSSQTHFTCVKKVILSIFLKNISIFGTIISFAPFSCPSFSFIMWILQKPRQGWARLQLDETPPENESIFKALKQTEYIYSIYSNGKTLPCHQMSIKSQAWLHRVYFCVLKSHFSVTHNNTMDSYLLKDCVPCEFLGQTFLSFHSDCVIVCQWRTQMDQAKKMERVSSLLKIHQYISSLLKHDSDLQREREFHPFLSRSLTQALIFTFFFWGERIIPLSLRRKFLATAAICQ